MAEAPPAPPPDGVADPVKVAAVWVEKAQSGSVQWTSSCSESQLRAYRLRRHLKPLTSVVKHSLLLLAVFEVPGYCASDASKCLSGRPGPGMHSSNLPVMPFMLTNTIAALLYTYLAWYQRLRWKSLGSASVGGAWHTAGSGLVAVALADCAVACVHTNGVLWFTSLRLSRLLRPAVFLCYTRSLREEAARVARSIPKYVDVFASLAICILFFTWVGLVLFTDSKEGSNFFGTWSNGITSLYILFTTANCPDVFLDALKKSRLYFLFFFSFLVITLYLLSNVLLASVYDAYKGELKSMVKLFYKNQREAVRRAFALLANDDQCIALDRWTDFFVSLCDPADGSGSLESSADMAYNKRRAAQVFQALDRDHNSGIDMHEFKLVLHVLNNPEIYIPRKPPPKAVNGAVTTRLKDLFISGIPWGEKGRLSWEGFMDCVITVDVTLAYFQTVLFVNASGSFDTRALDLRHPWYWTLLAFSLFYMLTVSLKIAVMGFERFWYTSPVRHRFDFFNVYGCFAAEVACLCVDLLGAHTSTVPLRIALLFHITRGLRLLYYIQPLRNLASFVMRLAPTYYRMGMLLVLVYYIYVQIGQQVFGGLIYSTNPALAGTDFAQSNYWPMNFNDFLSGMVTLFVVMVVNNWFIITAAYVRASGTRWAVLFFVSFLLLVNMIVLNILMALIIDCSGTVRDERTSQDEPEGADGEVPSSPERRSTASSPAGGTFEYEAVLRQVLLEDEDLDAERPWPALGKSDYGSTGQNKHSRSARRATTMAV